MKIFRDIKTEALLIYIKTLCNDYIKKIDKGEYKVNLGKDSYNEDITKTIFFLRDKLKESIFDAYELKTFIDSYMKETKKKNLPPQYEALLNYYNIIVLQFDKNFKTGEFWIPEQIIFALLSEWIYEEKKSVRRYPFLLEIDYLKLLSYFENVRNNNSKDDLKESIRFMYKISSEVISKLKNAKSKKLIRSKSKRKK
ncbi:hypothetical protein [Halarcobacter sp.]|uniref:hypothetical protein n=1 Tax=Halarcobacter sp. TaxID=2321133 RepID=UPI0029F50D5B|nr:hypothetical protein [Halarcobacter sp.]